MTSRAHRALRIACLLYFLLVAANYAAVAWEEGRLALVGSSSSDIYTAGSAFALLGALIATLGLLAQKRWAAYGHLASTALMVAFSYTGEPVLAAGPRALVSTAIYVLSGMMYGLAFFTDALEIPEE